MIVFINDIPVRIYKSDENPLDGHFSYVLDTAFDEIAQNKLVHHVWIKNVRETHLDLLLQFLNSKIPTPILSLHLSVYDYDAIKTHLRSKFKVVKAAGGLVRKKDKFLMIYRMKKWDLPKGKKEKREKYRQTAVREVEEECNVTVKIGAKICTTWHTYTMNKRNMIKKTRWYVMDVLDDSKMKPNLEEDIEQLRWMKSKEVYHALEHSYKSIQFVFDQYYQMEQVSEK